MKSYLLIVAFALMCSCWTFAADNTSDIYNKNCASCHGVNGKGDTPDGKKLKTPDLGSSEVQNKTDDQLNRIITDGKGKMPKFGGKLTPKEISDLVTFIRRFKPPAPDPAILARLSPKPVL